jgi:predicted acylesterase/phospholipase RssA
MELLGLALSGGGIRSATFNLGLLQALAEKGLLQRIDYLSTVSGGGYIGSWLTAWIRNSKQSITELMAGLAGGGCDEIEHLREYSNYLTPRRGAWSADTWSAAATYIRNVLLNLTTLLLLVVTVLVALMSFPVLAGQVRAWLAPAPWVAESIATFGLVVLALVAGALMTHELQHAVTPEVPKGRWQLVPATRMLLASLLLAALLASPLLWQLRKMAPAPISQICTWAVIGAVLYTSLWLGSALLSLLTRSGGFRRVLPLLLWSPPAGALAGSLFLMVGWLLGWLARLLASLELSGAGQAGTGGIAAWLHARGLSVGGGAGTARLTEAMVAESFAPWLWLAFGPFLFLLCFYLTSVAHTGLMGRSFADLQREWWSRLGAVMLRSGSLWLLVTTIAFAGPACFFLLWLPAKVLITSGWLGSTVAGVLLGRSQGPAGKLGGKTRDLLLAVAPVLFFVGLLLFASLPAYMLLTGSFTIPGSLATSLAELGEVGWERCLVILGTLGAVALLLSWRIDVNEFSMNLLYRHRLVRAFLGASRRRTADAFTDFDPGDDLPLAADDGVVKRPYHLINTTLNLASRQRLAWQQRKAASFIFSPLYSGYELASSIATAGTERSAPVHAYQPTRDWGTRFRSAGASPLTLGAAMAISGAAVSPSMGYRTKPLLAALLTVFNVRLGWWVGNPNGPDWLRRGPKLGISLLVRELCGLTTDRNRFVYLSDGGHFENLGLYELVRRRCRFIIAADAGMDRDFLLEDLANAIRKCRTDLGIEIEIDPGALRPDEHGLSSQHHVVGQIRYDLEDEGATPGLLVYFKASLTGDEPADIRNYAAQHPLFPHEPTTDQWFDETQFESYRRLGLETGRQALKRAVAQAHCLAGTRPESRSLPSSELVFVALNETSLQPTRADQKIAIELGNRLSRLFRRLHGQPRLAFLVPQVFPELRHLLQMLDAAGKTGTDTEKESSAGREDVAEKGQAEGKAAMALPSDGETLRAGFAFSLELIQLMKDIFYGLNLVHEYRHPNNRGWINLFRHLTWAPIVRLTWAATASTLTPAFQRFGEQCLGLAGGDIQLIKCVRVGREHPERAFARTDINFFEKKIATEIRSIISSGTVRLYRFHFVLPDRIGGQQVSFPFGLAVTIARRGGPGEAVVYLRVQDHLRLMGLARRALRVMFEDNPDLGRDMTVVSSVFEDPGLQLSEPIGESDLRSFERLFDSVRREQR